MNRAEQKRPSVADSKQPEVRRDRLGRRINPNSLRNLRKFKPGQSGNPGGSYKRRPYTEAGMAVAMMRVKDLKIRPTDSTAMAAMKSLALQGIKGNVAATTELANRVEGKPGQRLQ